MNEEPQGDQHSTQPPDSTEKLVHHVGSGCLSAFIVLWGVAFLLVGLLFLLVSGYCGFIVLEAGGSGSRDLGGFLIMGLMIGIVLCVIGFGMLRRDG
jgi:hypothetical protein